MARLRVSRLTVVVVVLASVLATSAQSLRAEPGSLVAEKAREYRGDTPVAAQPDGLVVAEAEEFAPVGDAGEKGWRSKDWGANYYAATFANTFLSRKAFLGAPEQTDGPVEAKITVNVPAAGRYLALVRYEAAYRFETQFKLRVEQGGQAKLDRLYGARDNLKVWAFSEKLKREVGWYWGAVENLVWEGHDAYVDLQAGPATLTVVADKQPDNAAKRNVDCVVLTTNEADMKDRIETEGYLPLDGLLTQSGDVFMKVTNHGGGKLTVTAAPCTQHSPYWVHKRTWAPVPVALEAGATSDWVDVGGLLDTLNDGQWAITAQGGDDPKAPVSYTLEFAVATASGEKKPIAKFENLTGQANLAYDANTRYTLTLRDADHVLYDLLDYLKSQPVTGAAPKRTLVYGYTFDEKPGDEKYNAAREEFMKIVGMTANRKGGFASAEGPADYIDVRGVESGKPLEEYCEKLKAEGRAQNIAVVSFGDEIGLTAPAGESLKGFGPWLQAKGLKPADVVPGATDWSGVAFNAAKETQQSNPRLFYYSTLFAHDYGINDLKARTETIRKYLPNARTGANFSPHHAAPYLGEAHKWVTLFRRGGMTMPWSEDYTWQLPIGSQQMTAMLLDISRAGVRNDPNADIHFYVMPHWPGNTPNSWRRLFYQSLGHGMTIVNLFEFRPVQAAYTENHVSLPQMYQEVRQGLYALGTFEDIIQDGKVRPAKTALWFSDTGDVWENHRDPFGAGKRSLYVALKNAQRPVDFVVEEDATANDGATLAGYGVLHLTDRNVSRAASEAIATWVENGGRLLASAGAGMLDEFNQPNEVMQKLLGVTESALDVDDKTPLHFEKQDLPFAQPIDKVKVTGIASAAAGEIPVFGCRSRVTAADGAEVLGTFGDGSPAVTRRAHGKGFAAYCGFLPGLSFIKPAMPMRPVDRGSTDDAMAHFIPTAFDKNAAAVINLFADGDAPDVSCSNPNVECGVVESDKGVVLTLINWSHKPVKGLEVVSKVPLPFARAELSSGGKVEVTKDGDTTRYRLDLDVADALVLR